MLQLFTSLLLVGTSYIQLGSSGDQLATATTVNEPQVVVLDKVDGKLGVSYDQNQNEITIEQDGTYFLMAVVQVGLREMGVKASKPADIDFWFELNGAPIPNAANSVISSPASPAKTIVDQMVLPLKAGDKLVCKFISTQNRYGIVVNPQTGTMPTSPGVTFTLYRIGD